MSIKVEDTMGIFEISYEEMQRYHGGDFYGGVALAYKLCVAIVDISGKEGALVRDDCIIVSGLNPPGVSDGLECVTRAISRERFVLKTNIKTDAPKAPCGVFYFEVTHNKKRIVLKLKDGLLPKGFKELAGKCKVGLCDKEELSLWQNHKKSIGKSLMSLQYQEIFDIDIKEVEQYFE